MKDQVQAMFLVSYFSHNFSSQGGHILNKSSPTEGKGDIHIYTEVLAWNI